MKSMQNDSARGGSGRRSCSCSRRHPCRRPRKAPVKLGQKVTIKGTKDVSSKSSATLEVELDDKYFNPTFIKAKAGEKITFEAEERRQPPAHVHVRRPVDRQADRSRQVDEVHRHGPERRRGVPVPLPLPRGRGHGRRGVHEGRSERDLDRDEQLVGQVPRHATARRWISRPASTLRAAIAVAEEAASRPCVRVVVVGDVAHVVVEPVLDGERLGGDRASSACMCASWSGGGSVPCERQTTIGT